VSLATLSLLAVTVQSGVSETPIDVATTRAPDTRELSAAEMFKLAERALSAGDIRFAERVLKTLSADPDIHIRNEARFRLAMLLANSERLSDAALLLRSILDEQPDAQRVRFELARLLELMGDETTARRALREVRAGVLPPDVARLVDLYSAALRSRKPIGASFELSIAPDSNINRATRSDTLGTVIGDFVIDDDAKQKSGIGAAFRGQFFARSKVSDDANLVAKVNAGANLYRRGSFNDLSLAILVGPEFALGKDRLSLEAGVSQRWYGGVLLSKHLHLAGTYSLPLDETSQLRLSASALTIKNRRNSLQDGKSYSLSVTYERALSTSSGISLTAGVDRQSLHDPGYSSTGGQAFASVYKDLGATTVFASVGHGRSFADARLLLFPEKRKDQLYQASIGASFRQIRLWSLSPLIRLTYESNVSSLEIYDYSKFRAEFGFTRAF
jgi:outer membrane protein